MPPPPAKSRPFVWCTYRTWSFRVLEGLLDVPGWSCGLIVTTHDCRHDLAALERLGIPVCRVDPRTDLQEKERGFRPLKDAAPQAIFHYGWSWLVPPAVLALCPNVTLHPGKLPRDRGGSPIQNQIRNGEDWTYANLIELVPGLDEGRIYLREKISLEGEEADAVWARMISAGILLTRRFLAGLALGTLRPEPQDSSVVPTVSKRVRPEQAELRPSRQTARQMHDIVRAHNETDPNSYVRTAWLPAGPYRLAVERGCLVDLLGRPEVWEWNETALRGDRLFEICHQVNNGTGVIRVPGCDGPPLLVTRCYPKTFARDDD